MKTFNLEQVVHRLLSPNKILAPWIFDEKEIMFEDVRAGLLKITDYIIEKTIKDIDGLEVTDICLTGSSADYIYHEKSDFDIKIVAQNKNCLSLKNNKKDFNNFLSAVFSGLFIHPYKFFYKKRFVDVKITSDPIELTGLYSILHQKWIVRPCCNKTKDISEEELKTYYLQKREKLFSDIQKIKERYFGVELGKHMEDLYIQTVLDTKNIKDYLAYKILCYEGLVKPIGSNCILTYNRALSLK